MLENSHISSLEHMTTSPNVCKEIVFQLNLEKIKPKNEDLSKLLYVITTSEIDISQYIEDIFFYLKSKPILEDIVLSSISEIRKNNKSQYEYMINMIYVLDCLTEITVNNINVFTEIQNHVYKIRRREGFVPSEGIIPFIRSWIKLNSFFGTIKLLSVDLAVRMRQHFVVTKGLLYSSESLKMMRRNKEISKLEFKKLKDLEKKDLKASSLGPLSINIYEAAFTEYRKGNIGNAYLGHVLAMYIDKANIKAEFRESFIKSSANFPFHPSKSYHKEAILPEDWVDAYIAWNWVFVKSEFENSYKFLAKLIPSCILIGGNENFINSRSISLWFLINSKDFLKGGSSKKYYKESASSIKNKKYALDFIKNSNVLDEIEVENEFQRLFLDTRFGLIKKIRGLAKN